MSAPVTTVGCAFLLASLFVLFFDSIGKTGPVPLPRPRPPEAPMPEYEFSRWARPVETVSYRTAAAQPATPVAAAPAAAGQAPLPLPDKIKRKAARERRTLAAYDICRGKGRVFTNGGRSWRCRRD